MFDYKDRKKMLFDAYFFCQKTPNKLYILSFAMFYKYN